MKERSVSNFDIVIFGVTGNLSRKSLFLHFLIYLKINVLAILGLLVFLVRFLQIKNLDCILKILYGRKRPIR